MSVGEEFLIEALDELGVSGAREGVEGLGVEVKELVAETVVTEATAQSIASDVAGAGARDAETTRSITTTAANRTVMNSAQEEVAAKAAAKGVSSAIDSFSGKVSQSGQQVLQDLQTSVLSNTEALSDLRSALNKPIAGRASTMWEEIKQNWGKLLFAGLTTTVVIVWLATGHGLQDLISAVGNIVGDSAKNLIGAFRAIGEDLAKPLGEGAGSALKTVGIILGAVAGAALLGYAIYAIWKKAKEDKAKKP